MYNFINRVLKCWFLELNVRCLFANVSSIVDQMCLWSCALLFYWSVCCCRTSNSRSARTTTGDDTSETFMSHSFMCLFSLSLSLQALMVQFSIRRVWTASVSCIILFTSGALRSCSDAKMTNTVRLQSPQSHFLFQQKNSTVEQWPKPVLLLTTKTKTIKTSWLIRRAPSKCHNEMITDQCFRVSACVLSNSSLDIFFFSWH